MSVPEFPQYPFYKVTIDGRALRVCVQLFFRKGVRGLAPALGFLSENINELNYVSRDFVIWVSIVLVIVPIVLTLFIFSFTCRHEAH